MPLMAASHAIPALRAGENRELFGPQVQLARA